MIELALQHMRGAVSMINRLQQSRVTHRSMKESSEATSLRVSSKLRMEMVTVSIYGTASMAAWP
jgi:hypothetical protein